MQSLESSIVIVGDSDPHEGAFLKHGSQDRRHIRITLCKENSGCRPFCRRITLLKRGTADNDQTLTSSRPEAAHATASNVAVQLEVRNGP